VPEGIPVIAAGGDAPVGAYGAGVKRERDALIMLSTGAQVILATSHAEPDPEGRWYAWPSVAPKMGGHAGYLNVGTLLNAGNVTTWADRSLPGATMPDRPTGLLALPHLIGTRANPGQQGAIIGVTETTTPDEIRRAVVEGIGYSLRRTLDGMTTDNPLPARILIGGGLAQSELNRQILADVLGVTLEQIVQDEVTGYGAGLLALHTLTGSMPDDASAPGSITSPKVDYARHYDDLYLLYCEADDEIATVTERLSMFVSDHEP
jgi:sugar (pentulose or hexulose) kinase